MEEPVQSDGVVTLNDQVVVDAQPALPPKTESLPDTPSPPWAEIIAELTLLKAQQHAILEELVALRANQQANNQWCRDTVKSADADALRRLRTSLSGVPGASQLGTSASFNFQPHRLSIDSDSGNPATASALSSPVLQDAPQQPPWCPPTAATADAPHEPAPSSSSAGQQPAGQLVGQHEQSQVLGTGGPHPHGFGAHLGRDVSVSALPAFGSMHDLAASARLVSAVEDTQTDLDAWTRPADVRLPRQSGSGNYSAGLDRSSFGQRSLHRDNSSGHHHHAHGGGNGGGGGSGSGGQHRHSGGLQRDSIGFNYAASSYGGDLTPQSPLNGASGGRLMEGLNPRLQEVYAAAAATLRIASRRNSGTLEVSPSGASVINETDRLLNNPGAGAGAFRRSVTLQRNSHRPSAAAAAAGERDGEAAGGAGLDGHVGSGDGGALARESYLSAFSDGQTTGADAMQAQGPFFDDDERRIPLTLGQRLAKYLWGRVLPSERSLWDIVIVLLLLWVCFGSPFVICFGVAGHIYNGDPVACIEFTVDVIFLLDMYLNFRTAYYDKLGQLQMGGWKIARHYLRTWFIIDLVSVFPFDLVLVGSGRFLSMLKLLRAIRMVQVLQTLKTYRLLRVVRLPRILERLERELEQGIAQMWLLLLFISLLTHLSACLFYYMAFLEDLSSSTWVGAYGISDASLGVRYLSSLYWAFTTTMTVGYGDITPRTAKEKILAIFVMILGVGTVGYVTSSLTSLLALKNATEIQVSQKRQLVMDVLSARKVPDDLAGRVYAFFKYAATKQLRQQETELLQVLPFKLRSRLLSHCYSGVLSRQPAFQRLRPDILIQLIAHLVPEHYVDGDIVVLQGDYATGMYFVSEGSLEVRSYDFDAAGLDPCEVYEASNASDLKGVTHIMQGKLRVNYYFGQASTLHRGCWPATVVARGCVELLRLPLAGLHELMTSHADLRELLMVARPPDPSPCIGGHLGGLSSSSGTPATPASPLAPVYDDAIIAADFPLLDARPGRRKVGTIITSALKDLGTGIGQGFTSIGASLGSVVRFARGGRGRRESSGGGTGVGHPSAGGALSHVDEGGGSMGGVLGRSPSRFARQALDGVVGAAGAGGLNGLPGEDTTRLLGGVGRSDV